jgi:cobalt/nickel transport system permease protein
MRREAIEQLSGARGALHRLDARWKIVATLVFVVAVIVTPIGAWTPLAVAGLALAFVVGLAGIPPGALFRCILGFLLLVGFLVVMIAPAHPARAQSGLGAVAASILIKNSLAITAMLVLAAVTPLPKLLVGLRRLGLPPILVATLQFMDRYRHVLTDELNRLATARRARTFNRSSSLAWHLLAGLIGILLLRSLERAERIHGAMLARGWNGATHTLND